jgi:hypothetical protein
MPLSKWDRKQRLPFGAQQRIADDLGEGYDKAFVSLVMNDKAQARDQEKVKRVREAIAARIGLPVEEVFPDPAIESAAARAS